MATPRLLVVSQDRRIRNDVERVFSARGYAVDAVPNAMLAFALNGEQSYDVAVLDEECGSNNGTDVFRLLKAHDHDLDGILCSPRPNVDTVERALHAGMRHVTSKPVDAGEVLALVENLSLESARPFDERFPRSENGMQVEEGVTKVSRAMRCEWCSRRTHWVEPCLGLYFCCQDCLASYRRAGGL